MTTASEFVDLHGGPKAVAEKLGKKPGAISLWKNRNRIPRAVWPEITTALGVDLNTLLAIEKASA